MTTEALRTDWRRASKRAREVGAIALGAVVLVAVSWTVVNGPRLHAAAEEQTSIEVTAENRDVCQRLGVTSTSPGGTDCAQELDGVRQRHEERIAKRSGGFL